MFSRYASAISTSTIMTLGLIYIMQTLIQIQPGVIVDPGPRFPVDWVRLPPIEEPPVTREDKIVKEDLIKKIIPPDARPSDAPIDTVAVPIPSQKAPNETVPTNFGQGDGPLVTMFNVQPVYPVRAQQRGIEGHVIVEFDVDANGLVTNVRVVESTNQIFDRPAIRAAERIKFKARVVDGIAVTTRNVRKLYRFDIENE